MVKKQNLIKQFAFRTAVLFLAGAMTMPAAHAQRGGRGGGGGAGIGNRVGGGGNAGGGPGNRAGGGASPSLGSLGGNGARPASGLGVASRPAAGGNAHIPSLPAADRLPSSRPSLGNASGSERPSTRPGSTNLPAAQTRPAPNTKPAPAERPSLSERPGFPAGGSNLGTTRPSLGGIGDAVTKLPGQSGNRPDAGNRPTLNNRPEPGAPATRPAFPTQADRPELRPSGSLKPATKPAPGPGLDNLPGNLGNALRPEPGGNTNRPSFGAVNRPGKLPVNPDGNFPTTRPAPFPGSGGNRPVIGDNNVIVNRPNVSTRPVIGGNRPGTGDNRPNIGVNGNWGNGNGNWGNGNGNWGNGNNFFVNNNNSNNFYINNGNLNRPAWDRPGNGWNNQYNNWHSHWTNNVVNPHYHGWYNGCWSGYWGSNWYAPLAWGAAGWGLATFMASYSSNYSYYNPYYVPAPTVVVANSSVAPYNYSQPIVINNYGDSSAATELPGSGNTAPAPNTPASAQQEATAKFDEGMASFRGNDFQKALISFDAALSKTPNDPVVHEVRALTLFALGKYNEAAAVLNSLLASAPGMDWTTLSALYDDPETYTQQLRTLEGYCMQHASEAASHFVLAYHYLVIGSKEEAVRALEIVVANQPGDVTAAKMLDALKPATTPVAPAPAAGAAVGNPTTIAGVPGERAKTPEVPEAETDLVGEWAAANGKSSIELSITDESKFTWIAREDGKLAAQLEGDLRSTADAITFETADQGALGGTVVSKGTDQWILMPPGAKEQKDGILFSRMQK